MPDTGFDWEPFFSTTGTWKGLVTPIRFLRLSLQRTSKCCYQNRWGLLPFSVFCVKKKPYKEAALTPPILVPRTCLWFRGTAQDVCSNRGMAQPYTKIDYTKKGTLILTALLEDLNWGTPPSPSSAFGFLPSLRCRLAPIGSTRMSA